MISSSATMTTVTMSRVKSAPSNAEAMSAPIAGPPVTSRDMPSSVSPEAVGSSAMVVRRSSTVSAVSEFVSPTSMGTMSRAACLSSLSIGPVTFSSASSPTDWPSELPSFFSCAWSSADSSDPSSFEATTMTDCLSASGNSTRIC
jgi:hypothetical protein